MSGPSVPEPNRPNAAKRLPDRSGSVAGRVMGQPRRPMPIQPDRSSEGTLTHIIDSLLDKGLVINADITVSIAGVELLGIRIRAALASFETAARYGLDFPSGTTRSTAAWAEAMERKETCPQCGKQAPMDQLLHEFCPWCGWRSALALSRDVDREEITEDAGAAGGIGDMESPESEPEA